MSERTQRLPHERETITETITAEIQTPPFEEMRTPVASSGGSGQPRQTGELVLADQGALSAEQRRVAESLNQLFGSLCGGVPGQYWPQALLDSAGRFNRPPFPSRSSLRERGK